MSLVVSLIMKQIVFLELLGFYMNILFSYAAL
jgi:hypothetical protein